MLNRRLKILINKIKTTKPSVLDCILAILILINLALIHITNEQPLIKYKLYSFFSSKIKIEKQTISTFAEENYNCNLLQENLNNPQKCTNNGGTWGRVSHKCFCLNADVL